MTLGYVALGVACFALPWLAYLLGSRRDRLLFAWRFRGITIERTETECRYVGGLYGIEPDAHLTILDVGTHTALVEYRIGTDGFGMSPRLVPLRDLRPAPPPVVLRLTVEAERVQGRR